MQCLYVTGTLNECLLRRAACFGEVKNITWTMIGCRFRRGVNYWRCPLVEGQLYTAQTYH